MRLHFSEFFGIGMKSIRGPIEEVMKYISIGTGLEFVSVFEV